MKRTAGFSLMEISIVLVVIGFIVAGVFSATSAIQQSKIRNIISEAEKYQKAYDIFYERFKYPPGDYPDAAKYWGNDCNGSTTGSNLCSGEGDFSIDDAANDALSGTSETYLAWKHFQAADLLEQNFTGLTSSDAGCSDDICSRVKENVPGSAWRGDALWYMVSGATETGLFLGKEQTGSWGADTHMQPKNAYSIDQKIDDGNPVEGYFRASFINGRELNNAATCLDGDVSYPLDGSSAYNLDNENEDCGAIFIIRGL